MRPLLALGLLAGCASDPDACWLGNQREGAGACLLPELAATIDGDGAEWEASDVLRRRSCFDCPAGDVDYYQVAREGADAVVLRAVTHGAPVADGSATYIVGFRPLVDPQAETLRAYAFELLFGGDRIDARMKPWFEFTGLPIEVAWGADGYEVRLPVEVLPFEGAAWFNTGIADGTPGNSLGKICWAAAATDDRCAVY
jgi:hypothetical protein